MKKTYTLANNSKTNQLSITCHSCKMTSYHPQDIEHKYCGNCNEFHPINTNNHKDETKLIDWAGL